MIWRHGKCAYKPLRDKACPSTVSWTHVFRGLSYISSFRSRWQARNRLITASYWYHFTFYSSAETHRYCRKWCQNGLFSYNLSQGSSTRLLILPACRSYHRTSHKLRDMQRRNPSLLGLRVATHRWDPFVFCYRRVPCHTYIYTGLFLCAPSHQSSHT